MVRPTDAQMTLENVHISQGGMVKKMARKYWFDFHNGGGNSKQGCFCIETVGNRDSKSFLHWKKIL